MEMPRERKYTYADYATWTGQQRYELIDGEAYMMSPAPSSAHQEISGEIFRQLANYLHGKPCKVFPAPFDVRLNAETLDDTVVQPDITVICDPGKIDAHGCKGAPDMVVEILSPSTANHDQLVKYHKYRESGVREYWIVNPEARYLHVFMLKDGLYASEAYGDTARVPVGVLEDCLIDLAEVFPPLPPQAAEEKKP